jgi:hypothetical protein
LYSSLVNPEFDHMILCVYQCVWDLSGSRMMAFPELKLMKKPGVPLTILLKLAGTLLGSYP